MRKVPEVFEDSILAAGGGGYPVYIVAALAIHHGAQTNTTV